MKRLLVKHKALYMYLVDSWGQFHKTVKQELRLKFFLKWKVYSYSVSQNLKLKCKIFHETGSWEEYCILNIYTDWQKKRYTLSLPTVLTET